MLVNLQTTSRNTAKEIYLVAARSNGEFLGSVVPLQRLTASRWPGQHLTIYDNESTLSIIDFESFSRLVKFLRNRHLIIYSKVPNRILVFVMLHRWEFIHAILVCSCDEIKWTKRARSANFMHRGQVMRRGSSLVITLGSFSWCVRNEWSSLF